MSAKGREGSSPSPGMRKETMGKNWNQPICDDCWDAENPGRKPFRLVEKYRIAENCAWCNVTTTSGIYVRVDPDEVPFPQEDKTEW